MKIGVILILAWFSVFAEGARILGARPKSDLIAVSDPDEDWAPSTYVCAYRDFRKAFCGDIIKTGVRGFIVQMFTKEFDVQRGDEVIILVPQTISKGKLLTFGVNFPYPVVHVQQLVSDHFAYGFMTQGILFTKKGTESIKGISVMGTANYYTGTLRGFWLRGGFGIHILNLADGADGVADENKKRTAVTNGMLIATAGWRLLTAGGFTIAGALGGQYFFDPRIRHLTTYQGLIPTLTLDFGLNF